VLLHNRKQDKSQPLSDIFITHEQINIDNCAGINQFRDCSSDLHNNNATRETSTLWSETVSFFPDMLPLSPSRFFFSLQRPSSCETRGCIQKADIPRDVPRDTNTYRLFTRRAIFEAIRQSDIWETFVSRRA